MNGGSSRAMVSRRPYGKPVPRGPRRYLRPAAASMWQPISRTSIASWAIDEPAAAGHVRDRDQLRARNDRALERGEVELAGGVAVDHVDLDARARLHHRHPRGERPP